MSNLELRIPCSLDHEPADDEHVHRCSCGTTWRHDNDLPSLTTDEEFEEAHSCPSCGQRQTNKFWVNGSPPASRMAHTLARIFGCL